MARTHRIAVALVACVGLGGTGALSAFASSNSPTPSASSSPPVSTLSEDAKKDLAFTREEERMARDLYQRFADKYDQARPFSNIVNAEARHFESVGILLSRYDLTDPASGKSAGKYAEAELQKLYDQWKAQGDKSLAEAYKVGVDLETRDIADLKDVANASLPSDVRGVYQRLLNGSESHLAAFTAATQGTTLGASGGQSPMGAGQCDGPGKGQAGNASGQCDGSGQARKGQGQGQGRHANGPASRAQLDRDCDGSGPGPGCGGLNAKSNSSTGNPNGYGRTGERPAGCPLVAGS